MLGRFLLGFGAFIIFTLSVRPLYLCREQDLCHDKAVSEQPQTDTLLPSAKRARTLGLESANGKLLSNYDQFSFDFGSHEPVLVADNNKFLGDITAYLQGNVGQRLKITGRYYSSEKKPTGGLYDNLGLARAAAIRAILVKDHGFKETEIDIDAAVLTESGAANKAPLVPLEFFAGEAAAKANTAKYEFTDMTFGDVNFEVNSAKLKPTEQFRSYVDSVVVYLKKNPKKKLYVIGHTDNDGSDKLNEKLGLNRAKAGAEYFKKKGVKNKITASSKGEKEPVVPNDTDENKSKNRRLNIQIK